MDNQLNPTWKKQFTRQKQFIIEIQNKTENLKFDRKYVIPSDIGSQFYCEQKLEREFLTGKIETEEMLQGNEGHACIVKNFKIVPIEEIWKDIYIKDQLIVAEFIFIANYNGTYIIGRPDIVLFINGAPILILEFKFSAYDKDFLDRHAQAQCYCLIMRELGFNVKSLFYSIVVFKPNMVEQEEIIKTIPQRVIKDFLNGDFGNIKSESREYGDIRAYLHKFNAEDAEKNVNWALKFWKGKREASYTDIRNKCLSCEFQLECRKNFF